MTATTRSPATSPRGISLGLTYGFLAAGGLALTALAFGPTAAVDPRALLKPMLAMFALTVVVWLVLPMMRNWAVLTRRASARYYQDFRSEPPPEWIERPARTYDNLMQAPILLYVISILMIVTAWADSVQVTLAWIFVALRAVHAAIYIGSNHLLARFASFALSSLALWEIWLRYALHAL
ncbi:MAPEG family protein [Methylocystis bryophila]|uniref:MAPEG family protein n=1 Tax=Methylocystis bryophila TaxID=655015 RepID=A0A1W6MZN8_9HYPH|nr:MAPEG family protein [Methylocystis bryophila]ARN83051.1 hypothetical protein B1812_20395 [Methylocystis bryophila]BDV39359.1 hypothetical protein DSM21852_26120 [Methylocystis bryophila]